MKKIFILSATIFLLVATAIQTTFAQKVAHIDVEAIIQNMPEYKSSKSQLEAYGKQLQKQLQNEEQKMASYYQEVMKKGQLGTLSPKEQKEAEAKLQQMQADLQKNAAQAEQKVMQKEQELTKPLYDKFNATLEKVAKENGYGYILDKKMILSSDNGIDATAKVKKALGL